MYRGVSICSFTLITPGLLVSLNRAGTGGANNISRSPILTPNGQFVVFASKASDLVYGDDNGVSDIFVRDRLRNITTLVSVNAQGRPANRPSTSPVLAGDGRTVLFQSFAGDLVAGDYNMKRDLFVLRLSAGDHDGDGMDDDWEMASFDTLARDGSGDFDNDGLTDKNEFLAGTDPANLGSVLRAMTLAPVGGGNTTILWHAVGLCKNDRAYRDNIEGPGWQDLPGTININGETASLVDTNAAFQSHRFYRVMLKN